MTISQRGVLRSMLLVVRRRHVNYLGTTSRPFVTKEHPKEAESKAESKQLCIRTKRTETGEKA